MVHDAILKSLDPLKEKKAASKAIRKRIFQKLQVFIFFMGDGF